MFKFTKKENKKKPRPKKLVKSYDENIDILKHIFSNDDTIIFREFQIQLKKQAKMCIVFSIGMVDSQMINQDIISPVLAERLEEKKGRDIVDIVGRQIITTSNVLKTSDIGIITDAIISGEAILLIGDSNEALHVSAQGYKTRNIDIPLSEPNIRGPKEGFSEDIVTNISLIRRKITNPELKFQFKELGQQTKTKICICYMQNLASDNIIDELYRRLDKIDMDGIIDSGYIQEFIRDAPLSPFKTIGDTEKPDKVVANMLEGRIAVIVNGSPSVLTLPFLFMEYFQASEDYYNNFWFGSFNRFLRCFSVILSSAVTSMYVAITTFHQEIIPTPLLLSISASREGLPFPTVVEAIGMMLVFAILREIGIRMPSPMGSTLGFVGAVILGQAAVSARFISAPMVIIVGITGISTYLLPKMIMPINVVRLSLLVLSAFLGVYGFILGTIAVILHLVTIRSFGIPYMLHIGSLKVQDIKDTALRLPWWYMKYRPKIIGRKNAARIKGRT